MSVETQDDDIMMMCLTKSPDDDIMMCLSKSQDDELMKMCLSKSQDDIMKSVEITRRACFYPDVLKGVAPSRVKGRRSCRGPVDDFLKLIS